MRRAAFAAAVLGSFAGLLAAQVGREPRSKVENALPEINYALPGMGLRIVELPPGPGRATAEYACLTCHSADIPRQQRLNEKQWAAVVTKMVGWGAEVTDEKRDELIAYLVKNFGPDNDRFKPVVTRPVGR